MSRRTHIASALLLACLTAGAAGAADFKTLKLADTNVSLVFVTGVIAKGDAERFSEIVGALSTAKATIVLESPGGLVSEALDIGAQPRQRDFATMVLPDKECFSACALIWIASTRSYMSASSNIGFHAAYITVDGQSRETGMGNAEIGFYLTHLGLRVEAIRFITNAPPEGWPGCLERRKITRDRHLRAERT